MDTSIRMLVTALFAAVGALLVYGMVRFRATEPQMLKAGRQVSMRWEVVWTTVSASLLFFLYVWAR